MKKVALPFILILLMILLITVVLLRNKSHKVYNVKLTSSDIVILSKNNTNNSYWIKAYDPNAVKKRIELKIIVDNKNTWQLLEVNQMYFASYTFWSDGSITLDDIKPIN